MVILKEARLKITQREWIICIDSEVGLIDGFGRKSK